MKILENAAKGFIDHCKFEKNLSLKTIKAYQIDLRQLSEFIQRRNYSNEVSKITKVELREYLESIAELKPKSIKRKVATFKSLFNFLEFEDTIEINPFRKMRINIKEQMSLPKALNKNQMNNIFKEVYKAKSENAANNCFGGFEILRNIVVVELLFATGARVSEIANLKDNMIDVYTGELKILGKGNKERIIHICNAETLEILRNYRHSYFDRINLSGGYFLVNRINKRLSDQSIRGIVKHLSNKAEVQIHVTPHMFRHTVATLLLENDVDIKYIQSILGHSSIMTTQIYTHVNRDKQRQILDSKHPRKEIFVLH